MTLLLQQVCQLGTGGSLAGTVHTHHHNDHRLALLGLRQLGQTGRKSSAQLSLDVVGNVAGILRVLLLQLLNERNDPLGTDIGRNEVGFQLIPINFGFAEELIDQTCEKVGHGNYFLAAAAIIPWMNGALLLPEKTLAKAVASDTTMGTSRPFSSSS